MNNDLISRKALKEDFKSRLARCDEWIKKAKDNETRIRADATKRFICEVIMTIDNAPTVDVKPFALFSFDKDELEQIVRDRVIEPIKNGELVVKTEERSQIISCFNCKHDYKSAADEPCKYCEKHCEWQAKEAEA